MTSRSNQTNKPLDKKNKSESSSIWGGRFEGKPHEIMDQINPSIDFDKRFSGKTSKVPKRMLRCSLHKKLSLKVTKIRSYMA